MAPPYRRLFPVFLLIFSISACAYLRRGPQKAKPETSETVTEEAKESFVDENKPSLSPPGYESDEKLALFLKKTDIESKPASQDHIKSLKEQVGLMDQKLEALYNFHQEDQQALKELENQLLQSKQQLKQLQEKLFLFPRQLQEMEEKYTRRINLQLSSDTLQENMVYEKAQKLYNSGNYVDAVIMFKKYISSFPLSTMADNAQYWIGEGYYSQRDYDRAIEEYDKVSIFPDNSKVPDALLRKGFCYLKLNKHAEARKIFSQIIDKYSGNQPEYAIVDSAKRKLVEIRGKK
jgi:tol-pal system protein YbgF